MAELIGIISGGIGIIGVTLHAVRKTSELFNEIAGAPEALEELKNELRGLEAVLEQLNKLNPQSSAETLSSPLQASLQDCQSALERLRRLANSVGTRGRGLRGVKKYLKKEELEDAGRKLSSQKLTLCLALQVTFFSDRKHDIMTGLGKPPEDSSFFQSSRFSLRRARTFADTTGSLSHSSISSSLDDQLAQLENALRLLVRKEIEDTGKRFLEALRNNPNFEVETSLHLNIAQAQKLELWSANLKEFQSITDMIELQERNNFLNSLPFSDYRRDRSTIKAPQDGTCKWIFHHKQYSSWKESRESSILHLSGIAGSGKSVLTKQVLNSLEPKNTDEHAQERFLYCFCNGTNSSEKTGETVLGTMIRQLVLQESSIFSSLGQENIMHSKSFVSPREPQHQSWTMNSLWETFLSFVRVSQLKTIYCFIDALDECDVDSISELLELISELATTRTKDQLADTELKFFLAGRPYEHIQGVLDAQYQIKLEPSVLNEDIAKVVDHRMMRLRRRYGISQKESDELHRTLVMQSEGMFLWVLFAIKQLEREKGVTFPELLQATKELPTELNGLYDRMLERIDESIMKEEERRLVERMINWVVLANRPLKLSELELALAVNSECTSAQSIRPKRNLSWLHGSFFYIDGGKDDGIDTSSVIHEDNTKSTTVRLIHHSAKDYFLGGLSPHLARFQVDERRGHTDLAITCINYVKLREFTPCVGNRNIEESDINNKELSKLLSNRMATYPFLEYAALNWPYHVRIATDDQNPMANNHPILQAWSDFTAEQAKAQAWYQLSIYLRYSRTTYARGFTALHIASLMQLSYIVIYILQNSSIDVNLRDSKGYTPLLVAANSNQGLTNREIVQLLLDRGADIEAKVDGGWNVLSCAALHGHESTVKLLLDRGADIEAKNDRGRTGLHLAESNDHKDVVDLLVERGADIKAKNNNEATGLHGAVTVQP